MKEVAFIKWVKNYLLRAYDYEESTGVDPQYLGFVDLSGNWVIMKITGSRATFAKGSSDYHANFSNCENLDYSYYFKLF